MTELDEFRAAKDEFLRVSPHSPLTPQQQRGFTGLNYFPESEGLRLHLPIEPFPEPTTIRMQTTTGDVQSYERYGQVRFSVDGQEVALTVYRNDNGYFLPFVDSLASGETYGAGRYLEPEELPDGHLLIDFNLAYNPYCAYNSDWSCPITPAENRLKVPIRAGEKVFHSEES